MRRHLLLLVLVVLAGCVRRGDPANGGYARWPDSGGGLDGAAVDAVADSAAPPDAAEAAGPPRVTVVTWNVARLFDTICDSGRCGPGDFEAQPSPAAFAARVDEVAGGIAGLRPDVVVLQEIENEGVLAEVHRRLPAHFRVAVIGETAGVDVAVIAAADLVEVRRHRATRIPLPRGGTTTFARELLEVHLDRGGAPLVVFAAHFRSQRDDDPDRRLAEAQAAARIVTAAAAARPEALVVLAGDLNDVPGSPALEALEADGRLQRVGEDVPASHAYTLVYRGRRFFLDHIFAARDGAGRYVPGSARVHRSGSRGFAGSDHAALSARFELPEAP